MVELEREHPEAASDGRSNIRASLDHIIALLKDGGFVHGMLVPKNIYAKITLQPRARVIRRHDNKDQAELRATGYNLADSCGHARFPKVIPQDSTFMKPGQEGQFIPDDHDEALVNAWFANWAVGPSLNSEAQGIPEESIPFNLSDSD